MAYEISMLFRRHPDMSVTPFAQVSELLYLCMRMLYVVLDGQTCGVIHADVATEPEKYAGGFKSEETRI